MGIAETIPGVSAGTIALLIGIYDRFIKFISSVITFGKNFILQIKEIFSKKFWSLQIKLLKNLDFSFALPLVFGMIIAVAIFSNLFSRLLSNYPMQTLAVFFGMIIASIYAPVNEIKWSIKNFILSVVSFIFFFYLFGLSASKNSNPSLVFIFFGGAIAVSAMVLPGISGSFVLLSMGLYEFIMSKIAKIFSFDFSQNNFLVVFVFILGIVFGFVSFIKILEYILEKHKNILMSVIFGLLIASLRILWPFLDTKTGKSAEYMRKISPLNFSLQENFEIIFFVIVGFLLVVTFLIVKTKTEKSKKVF